MPQAASYLTIAPLKAYIERIGAEELNFRKFIVRIYRGNHYYHERCLIKINDDFTISCTNSEYAPTADEAAAIAAALQRVEFPRSIHATAAQYRALQMQQGQDALLYAFFDRTRAPDEGNITMAQERVQINGRKAYLPWTMWSDGLWRSMEPEGKLPLWKPAQATGHTKLMIHEGAKTAHYVHNLCNNPDLADDLAAHPWGNELKQYEHWGMIGGALAPQRTDYSELTRERTTEVVYVCDNDWPGKSALKTVSRCYGHKLKGVMFDERWKETWDLADAMPPEMFGDDGRWCGPTLAQQMQAATFATEQLQATGPGRPTTICRNEFAEEWIHCVTPEVFLHKDWPNKILTASEFNHVVRAFSTVDDTARLLKAEAANRSAMLEYNPAREPGIYNDASGNRYVNTHTPSPIVAVKGDAAPWLDFMHHLIPVEEDCIEALRWCATLIAKPENKMLYGILLVSEIQGIGKSTLGEKILAPLLGHDNVSYPSENDIVESNFNYWSAHKRLAIIHEIYAGHSAKAYNKLKSVLTDKTININKKYQAGYEIENWMHIFACSNSPRALQLSHDDRRWLVPKVTQIKRPTKYWVDFNAWLTRRSGLGIIKNWAIDWIAENGPVVTGAAAPFSTAKKEVIEEGYSPGMVLAAQFLAKAKEELSGVPEAFILDTALVKLVQDVCYEGRLNDRLEKPATMRKLAKAEGWHIGERKARIWEWGLRNQTAKIIALDPALAAAEPRELHARNLVPFDVTAAAQRWLSL